MALSLNFWGVKKSQNVSSITRLSLFMVCPLALAGLEEGNIFLRLKNKQVGRMLLKAISKKSPWRAARQEGYRGVAAFLSDVKAAACQKQLQME